MKMFSLQKMLKRITDNDCSYVIPSDYERLVRERSKDLSEEDRKILLKNIEFRDNVE